MKSNKGEGYIDICVGVVVFVMILVVALNLFSLITLRVDLDRIADELIEAATYSGRFRTEFSDRNDALTDEYFDYNVDYGADEYFNATYHRVQLGKPMWVEVSKTVDVQGLGVFKIPVTLTVRRTGLSQKYWK